jgi:hypothetical protein
MAARQATFQSLKSIAGATFLALGLVLLFANLEGVGVSVSSLSDTSSQQTMGILSALGLAALHAAQAYVFDQPGLISGFLQFLVSFWPLVLIAIGAALLRGSFAGPVAKSEAVTTS